MSEDGLAGAVRTWLAAKDALTRAEESASDLKDTTKRAELAALEAFERGRLEDR
jgi:hypothetical protein